MTSNNDPFLSGGDHLPLVSWEVGMEVEGQILEMRQVQFNDLQTGQPKTWDNGDPKKDWVFDLDTNADGTADVSMVVTGNLYTKMRDALTEANLATVGAYIKAKNTEMGEPKKKGFNPPRLFAVEAEAGPAIRPKDAFVSPARDEDDGF